MKIIPASYRLYRPPVFQASGRPGGYACAGGTENYQCRFRAAENLLLLTAGSRQRRYSQLAGYTATSREAFEQIRSVLKSGASDAEKLAKIEAIVSPLTAPTAMLPEKTAEQDTYYSFLKAKSLAMQKRVSDIIREVEFQQNSSYLMGSIDYYKAKDGKIDRHAPLTFLDPKEQELVVQDGKFQVSLYKALFFKAVCNGIKAGRSTCGIPTASDRLMTTSSRKSHGGSARPSISSGQNWKSLPSPTRCLRTWPSGSITGSSRPTRIFLLEKMAS